MRFIIHEQPYEKVVAAGELRYERDGVATGAVERWRLTTAVDNYTFLRIDLDARAAPSGLSTLYHLVLGENGRPERLRLRQWHSDHKIAGNVLFEPGVITASREVDGESFGEELAVTDDVGFWLPSSVGLSLLAGQAVTTAVSLQPTRHKQHDLFSLFRTEIRLSWDADEEIVVMGRAFRGRPFIIQWADQQYTLWLDEQNCVLQMMGGNRVTAVATRLIYYK
ncbi:MAG: hypothetical protein H6658_04690 [Ardenticatenaceae bacterium]|nr:hypothetical protein [Ardenticatenaceae bacterium]